MIRRSNSSARRLRYERLESRSLLATIVPGLVAHWNFNEGPDWHDNPFQSAATTTTAQDSVGNNDAVLTNASPAAFVSGREFTGLAFDGVDDYLALSQNLGTTLGGTAAVSFWIRTTQVGQSLPANSPAILGGTDAGGTGVLWGRLDNTGRIGVTVNGVTVVRSAAPINDDEWHFIALTRNAATGEVRLVCDSNPTVTGFGPTGTFSAAVTRLAQSSAAGSAPTFQGRLDQVSVFNAFLSPSVADDIAANAGPKTWRVNAEAISGVAAATPSVLFQTYDPDQDELRVASFSQPQHGVVAANGEGSFAYTSQAGFTGNDSFEVIVEDGRTGFAVVQVQVRVSPPATGDINDFTTVFAEPQVISAGGSPISLASWRVPRAVEWNQDGRTDLLVSGGGNLWRYLNTGTSILPAFAAGVKVQAAGVDISTGSQNLPFAIADLDGDFAPDLIVSEASSRRVRFYRNTVSATQSPVYAAFTYLQAGGTNLVLADPRFDTGDWNADGKPDLIVGHFAGDVQVFLNNATTGVATFNPSPLTLWSDAYNIYPRMIDLSRDGIPDLLRGINWGDVRYWINPADHGGDLNEAPNGYLAVGSLSSEDLHQLVDGPIVDFADFNGDGVLDLVLGGHVNNNVRLAFGVKKTTADYLAELEAVYDAHPTDLGAALSANNNELLEQVKNDYRGLISLAKAAPVNQRAAIYDAVAAHIQKYSFLRLTAPLNTTTWHHVPGIVAQNFLLLHNLLPDTPQQRIRTADALGLPANAVQRRIYIEHGLIIGDNLRSSAGQLASLEQFMRSRPRENFPDTLISIDNFFGDGRSAIVDYFGATKNTFGDNTGVPSNEWAADLRQAILAADPAANNNADLFTFVVGHEATHSLDAYINSRANRDLRRRWGQTLVGAGGPLIAAQSTTEADPGWIDWADTKARFLAAGRWDGVEANWSASWAAYWQSGPGAAFRNLSFMRGSIDWFFENPQESLATQGNQYWADSEARLIGALDRFERGYRSNLTEVMTFIDYLSAGLNRIQFFDIDAVPASAQAAWDVAVADLQRDDLGRIEQLTLRGGKTYRFGVDQDGVYNSWQGVAGSPFDWHNSAPNLSADVDDNGVVDPQDVLWSIWFLQSFGAVTLPQVRPNSMPPLMVDINDDGEFDVQDVSFAIFEYQRVNAGGEGESDVAAAKEEATTPGALAGGYGAEDDFIRGAKKRRDQASAVCGRTT